MCLESIGNNVVTNLEYNGNAVKEVNHGRQVDQRV